jgi:hypothetical protein
MDQMTQLIEVLGIQAFSPEEQQNIVDQYQLLIGEALTEGLSEEQLSEYQQIIDGNQEVITNWLAENEPEYKNTIAYEELNAGYDQDPEKTGADKVYASMAWVQHNAHDIDQTVARIQEQIKANPAQYK